MATAFRIGDFYFLEAYSKKEIRLRKIEKLNGISDHKKIHHRLVKSDGRFTNDFRECYIVKKLETIIKRKNEYSKLNNEYNYEYKKINRDQFIEIFKRSKEIRKNNFFYKSNIELYKKEVIYLNNLSKKALRSTGLFK